MSLTIDMAASWRASGIPKLEAQRTEFTHGRQWAWPRANPLAAFLENGYRVAGSLLEGSMRRIGALAMPPTLAVLVLAGFGQPTHAQGAVTAFEGARLIVGDERAPVENATVVVEGA